MRRTVVGLGVLVLAALVVASARPAQPEQTQDEMQTRQQVKASLPEPAREGGYFQRGGADIGRGYAHGGKEFGRGAAGFGKNFLQRDFAEAGRSLGRGGAEFGKGVGIGTARGFKNFAVAFRTWGKKVDASTRDDEEAKKEPESD